MLGVRKKEAEGAHQSRIDAIVAAARAGTERTILKPDFKRYTPPPLEPTTDGLCKRLQEELNYVRRLVVASGDALSDDPIVLNRYASTLQNFDLIAQILGHLASVVGSEDRHAAIERIGMAELRARLERSSEGMEQDRGVSLYRHQSNPFSV